MFGKVITKEINKMGLPYAIIKGTDGVTYYCDNRGMEIGKVEELVIGANVEFLSYKDKKGKLIATHLKYSGKKTAKASMSRVSTHTSLDTKERENIRRVIVDYFADIDSIMLTQLNKFLLGKNKNYHTYGYKKPKSFLMENFSDVLDFDDVMINGCPQTMIKLKSRDLISVNTENTDEETEIEIVSLEQSSLSIYEEFDQLIEDEDYEGALRSKLISTVAPNELSLVYMEKAILAARKLLAIEDELIISEFDKKIITIPMSSGLFVMKKDESFMKEGQEECFEKCNAKIFRNFFNALNETNTHNTTYLEIAKRFQTVYNKLFLPFYVLAAYASNKIDVADEYLKFIQEKSYFNSFVEFNKIIRDTIFAGQEINPNYTTKVLSIALDADRFDLFSDYCSQILGETYDFVQWLDEDEIQYEKIVNLLSPNSFFKEKVVEKYINYYMYRKLNDGKLSIELIRLLSEIAYAYPISYLEEIMANNSYVGFGRVYKRDLLLNNFVNIIEYMKINSKAYPLACFVIENFMADDIVPPDAFFETARRITNELSSKLKSDPMTLYEVYPMFKLDAPGRSVLEEIYCDYMDTAYSQYMSVDESRSVVCDFNNNYCSFATVYYIENRENQEELLSDSEISQVYLKALKNNTNYTKAIKYVKAIKKSSDVETREIVKILYMNFKEYGISAKAYEIFDNDFTIEYAEKIALENFTPNNGTPIILMGIYSKKNDLVRVLYLYAIFYDLTKIGNRTFYSQLHKTDARISSIDNHYKVIRKAFTTYNYDELISFLNWTGRIIIHKKYKGGFEICKKEIDRLLKMPKAKQNWEAIISKLAKDDIRQINSPFGYSVQCIYLLQFYNFEEETERLAAESLIDQLTHFASFSKVSDTTNFISLNIKMINAMPETYVIKFAEFFERNSAFFAENTEIDDNEIEELYVMLLQKYNNTFEEEYFTLAVKFYDVFANRLTPHLELYKNFCRSSNNKAVLFKMMFKLYSPENALLFHEFIYYNDWNCTDEEAQVLELLRIIYALEGDELPNNLSCISSRLLESFKIDVAMLLQDYPRLTKYNTLMSKDETLAYKYLVLQYVMKVAFDQNVYWDTSDKYWDVCDQNGVWEALRNDSINGIRAALDFFKVSYAKQCKHVQSLGIEYITRRYNNLYLIDLYNAIVENGNISDINDEYIIELMRENKHISLIYDKEYKAFKNLLNELCNSNISVNTMAALLLSVIRGTLCTVFDEKQAFSELLCKTELHSKIKKLFEMTGYPSLAQSALYLYFNSAVSVDLLSFCETVLPSTFNAIISYNSLYDEESKRTMRAFIDYACTEMNHKQFLFSVIENKLKYYNESNYNTYKPILINIIVATVFNYNILRDLGNVVRQGKNTFSSALFKDLLFQMDEESVYWYLCSIQSALSNKKDEATAAFYKVGGKNKVPELWEAEYENMEKYIKGEIPKFNTLRIYNDFSTQREDVIGKTILVDIATNSVNDDVTQIDDAKSAMEVFVNSNSTQQERLNAGAIILSFVKNDALKFIQSISKPNGNSSGENLTYNEFIFEYGLLVIKSRKTLSSKKVDVIIELFNYFELLNDKNRRKFEESLKNAFVNLLATVKTKDDVISYEKWIAKSTDIIEITQNHQINFEGYDFFLNILEKCVDFEAKSYTSMEKIHFLESLPEGISVQSVAKSFLNAAKKELEKLQNGVMAKITTNNCEIEDDSIFVLIENMPQSHVAINLSPETGTTKFVVSALNIRSNESIEPFEIYCSGNIENIRPGQFSGEHIVLPKYVTNLWSDGDIIDISIALDVKGIKICNNTDQGIRFKYCKEQADSGIKTPLHRYGTSSCAFTEDNKGFGRTSDKEWLDTYIPTKGLSIIYGPSRVGKSSLLKYISNFLAVDYKNNQGAFSSSNKKTDVLYVISHRENYHKLPESEDEKMTFLFLEPIKTSLMSIIETDMIDSEDKDGANISRESAEQIIKFLDKSEKELSLEKKIKTISKVLSNNNAEIWVLIDEFQQVVEKWSITQSVQFREFCKQLKESVDNIRYVLCGADELVKLMINRDPVMVMYKEKTRAIGQFTERDKHDFFDMLRDTMIWGNNGHPYTQEALDYIFTYTGGNAMYGKLIGNRVIGAIEAGEFNNRKKIYPYDVSSVVAKMLSEQKSDIHATSAVNEFIANVTKNLEAESPYLVYIAWLMLQEPDRTSVSSTEIYEYFGATSSNEMKIDIDTALLLCSVRGILNSKEENGESVYSFSTTFYFSQYCEIVKRNGVPKKVVTTEDIEEEPDVTQPNILDIMQIYDTLTPQEKYRILSMVYADETLPEKAMEEFKKRIANHYRDIIDTQNNNNIQINAQTINTAFNTLLGPSSDGKTLLQAFQSLPSLGAYIPDDQRSLISSKTQQLLNDYKAYDACFSDNGECIDSVRSQELNERITEAERELEYLNVPAEREMLSDTMGAVVSSDAFMDVSEQQWTSLLKVDEETVSKLRNLPAEISTPLSFAVVLHNVFNEVYKGIVQKKENGDKELNGIAPDKMDFCPVAIMYCKIVESILKKTHTPLYIKGLGEKSLKLGGNAVFADLGTPENFNEDHKDLSIGSFVSHLVFLPKRKLSLDSPMRKPNNNDYCFGAMTFGDTDENYSDNIRRLIDDADTEDEKIGPWKVHARALKIVHEIRNRSAHEAIPITKENFDWLIEVLFEKGEFLRIWDLSK